MSIFLLCLFKKQSKNINRGKKLKERKGFAKVKLPARASLCYLAISLAGKAVGFVTTPIFTRLLSGDEYGKYTLYMTLIGGISVICSAISSGSAVYKGLQDHGEEKEKYLRSVLLVNSAFSTLFCILLFTFSDYFGLNSFLFLPLALQVLCDGIVAIALTSAKFYYNYKLAATLTLGASILPPIISVLLLKTIMGGYKVRVYSLLFVSIICAIYSLSRLLKGGAGVDRESLIYVARGAAPLLPHSFSTALSSQADKFIISNVLGAGALGKYSVVFSLGVALQFIITSVGSALNPWIMRKLDSGKGEKVRQLLAPMFLGFSALSLCVIAGGPEALLILAPKEYLDAFPALLPLALSCPFFFLSSVVTVGLVHRGWGRYSVLLSVMSGVLCVILNYTLIHAFGFFGAGLATLLCRVIEAFIGIFLLGKEKEESLFSVKSTAASALVISAVGGVIFLAKNLLWVRVFLLIIPATILVYCLTVAKELVFEKDAKTSA